MKQKLNNSAIIIMLLFATIGLFGAFVTGLILIFAPDKSIESVFYVSLFPLIFGIFGFLFSLVVYNYTK